MNLKMPAKIVLVQGIAADGLLGDNFFILKFPACVSLPNVTFFV